MFSLYLPQWPDCSHNLFVYNRGVLISLKASRCRSRTNPSSALYSCVPFGRPEHGAWRDRIQIEQIELLAQHAMITLARFLEIVQMRVEFFLLEKRGRVDALQHLPLLVAAPVRAPAAERSLKCLM